MEDWKTSHAQGRVRKDVYPGRRQTVVDAYVLDYIQLIIVTIKYKNNWLDHWKRWRTLRSQDMLRTK